MLQTQLVILSDSCFSDAFGLFYNLVSTELKYVMVMFKEVILSQLYFYSNAPFGYIMTSFYYADETRVYLQHFSVWQHSYLKGFWSIWTDLKLEPLTAQNLTHIKEKTDISGPEVSAEHWQYDSNNFWLLDSVQAWCRRAWLNELNYAAVGNLSSLPQASLTWPWLHNYYMYLIPTLSAPPECPLHMWC